MPIKEYYDTRAPEYDEWYLGLGRFAERERPGWHEEVEKLIDALRALAPARTLDVACGTGFLTRQLNGDITGLDQSEQMLAIARERVPGGTFVQGDALSLPFEDGRFERLVTGHFYGHLNPDERERFLGEARRVAAELVIIDSAIRPDHAAEEVQTRVLNDGSRFEVYKRYFDGATLQRELGGGTLLLDGDWFVVVVVACAKQTPPG
jgi:demethylmenaquinone methyltransferase/2-methoxy-6-polyprenyl-1,4-benzoquinol methylase